MPTPGSRPPTHWPSSSRRCWLPGETIRKCLADGLRFLWGNVTLRWLTILLTSVTLIVSAADDIVIFWLKDDLHSSSTAVGAVMVAAAAGGLGAAGVAGWLRRRVGVAVCWLGSYAAVGMAVAVLGLADSTSKVAPWQASGLAAVHPSVGPEAADWGGVAGSAIRGSTAHRSRAIMMIEPAWKSSSIGARALGLMPTCRCSAVCGHQEPRSHTVANHAPVARAGVWASRAMAGLPTSSTAIAAPKPIASIRPEANRAEI
jgi:hypothetical protein